MGVEVDDPELLVAAHEDLEGEETDGVISPNDYGDPLRFDDQGHCLSCCWRAGGMGANAEVL